MKIKEKDENKSQFNKIDVQRVFTNMQEWFKSKFHEKSENNSMEDLPINQESVENTKDEVKDKNYNKYGRTRAGYVSGLYFYDEPFTYNDGGIV